MPARSVCLVTLSLSEAGPGRFGRQASVTDICHAMPCHAGTERERTFGCLFCHKMARSQVRVRARVQRNSAWGKLQVRVVCHSTPSHSINSLNATCTFLSHRA